MSTGVEHMGVPWSITTKILSVIASILPAYELHLDRISVPQEKFGLFFSFVVGFFSEKEALQN